MLHSDWICTASGHELDLINPRPGHIDLAGTASSLAQINRFTGHALRPYSVAEHSLLVCEIAQRELGLDVFGQFAALVHDYHESVTGDMHTPGKRQIGQSWVAWEQPWERFFARTYGVKLDHPARELVKQADLLALATERRDLVHPACRRPWAVLDGIDPLPWINLRSPDRIRRTWVEWRDMLVDRHNELEFAVIDASMGAQP